MARYCCATSRPCACGARMDKSYTKCDECREHSLAEAWENKPTTEWDGAFPIGCDDPEEFFWDTGSVLDFIDEQGIEEWKTYRVCGCSPNVSPKFSLLEFLEDCIGEDCEAFIDVGDIDKIVNEHIEGTLTWYHDSRKFDPLQVARMCGWEAEND